MQAFERASGSKKKKFEKMLCPYSGKGYHLEEHYMRNQLEEMSALLKHLNIAPPRENKLDEEAPTEDAERCHDFKSNFSPSSTYIIDSGASNHMVSSKESFSTISLSKGPNIYMGDDSQIPTEGRGSIKAKHGEFKNVLYVPSLATNMLSIYQMTHAGSPKRVRFN